MNGIMNENQLTIVKKYQFVKPLIHKTDSIIDNCYRDYHNEYIHTFECKCEYVIQLTDIRGNEIINITIPDKSMGLFELNEKLTVARRNGFIFNQINKLTIKIYSILQSINICYYLKHRLPICHRLFFRRISKTKEFKNKEDKIKNKQENFCNDLNNPFHFSCRKWYLDNPTL